MGIPESSSLSSALGGASAGAVSSPSGPNSDLSPEVL